MRTTIATRKARLRHGNRFPRLARPVWHLACHALIALALAGAANAAVGADPLFTFAAFGDTPYNDEEEAAFPDFIAGLNREDLAFAVHVGDFKSAVSACTDARYLQRREWFALSHHAFAYVPGDNDWLDCRRAIFDSRDPGERLQKLRAIFFRSGNGSGQAALQAIRQSDVSRHAYPEHLQWQRQGVLFVTLNIPGPNNNSRDPAEQGPRNEAVSAWLDASFRSARERGLRAVVVFMHAAPWTPEGTPRRAFRPLLEQLERETLRFGRSVLLVHGDDHQYLVDRSLRIRKDRSPIENFTRVEVFGSPGMNWVRIRVSEDAGRITFRVTPGG